MFDTKTRFDMKKNILFCTLLAVGVIMRAQSAIDTHIAKNDVQDENTFALVIANENYSQEASVPYALRDGEVFRRYLTETLGIPEKQVLYAPDATLTDIKRNLGTLEKLVNTMNGEARAIVYYSGHGMPDDSSQKAYLMPTDGYSADPSSCMPTDEFYKRLGSMNARQTLVFLDACFSGASREGGMIRKQGERGVAIKEKPAQVQGKMVVFSATNAGQTAHPYKEKAHGMFTYYVLEELQKTGGDVTLGELSDKVKSNVGRVALIETKKDQTPTVTASSGSQDWRNWKLAGHKASRYVDLPMPVVQQKVSAPVQPTTTEPATTPKQNKPKRSYW